MRRASCTVHCCIALAVALLRLDLLRLPTAAVTFLFAGSAPSLRQRSRCLQAFFGDGFDGTQDMPFTQAGDARDREQRRGRNRYSGPGVDEIQDDNQVYNTGYDPYVILDISPMDEIGPDELRAAFRKQAKKFHPDVPGTGDPEKFQLIKRAVEELASLNRVGAAQGMGAVPKGSQDLAQAARSARKERSFTVTEEFWELRGRDFFAEIETELTDELRRGFNESDVLLTDDQIRGRMKAEDKYWKDREERSVDNDILARAEDWKERKRDQRRLLIRQRLRGGAKEQTREEALTAGRISTRKQTLKMIRARVAGWLGIPETMFEEEMSLEELGFFDAGSWKDVAVCLMLLEEDFGRDDLFEVAEKGKTARLQLPKWVSTVADFVDFVESKS